MKITLFTTLICCSMTVHAQLNIDSLKNIWKDEKLTELKRLSALDAMAIHYLDSAPDSSLFLAGQQFEFAAIHSNMEYKVKALQTMGQAQENKSDHTAAIKYYQSSLDILETMKNKTAIGDMLYKLGVLFDRQGNDTTALDYLNRSLNIRETLGDQKKIAATLNFMGLVYEYTGKFDKAFEFYHRSLQMRTAIADSVGMAWTLNNLGNVYESLGNYAESIRHHNRSMTIRSQINDQRGLAASLNNLGVVLKNQGDYVSAIQYFSRGVKISEQIGDKLNMGNVFVNLGSIYYIQSDYPKALEFYNKSLNIYREIADKSKVSLALSNMAIIYKHMGDYAQAIRYYEESIKISEEIGNLEGLAISLNNIGICYKDLKEYTKASDYLLRGLTISEELGSKAAQASSLLGLGSLYLAKKQYGKSLFYSNKALEMAKAGGYFEEMKSVALNLYKAYRQTGQYEKAIEFHELYHSLQDSIIREENQRELLRQEYKYNYEKQALSDSLSFATVTAVKDLALTRQQANLSKQRTALFGTGGGVLFIALLAFSIFQGKKRSDELLLNILPAEVAKELKQKGYADAREFEEATVLFTDFKGFTALSEQLTADELIKEINICFKAFDRIVEKYQIEKIKTIGDAYMAAGGLHVSRISRPIDVINAGIEMQQFISTRKAAREAQHLYAFEMRAGIHTGTVVAGIVGIKKFQYDIWGDTVNVASRMESLGEVGKVNISETTYQLVKDVSGFNFEPRGSIEVKGKGAINMYFASTASG